jgi:hypothetical protein
LIIDELSLGLASNAVELPAESLAKFEGTSILLIEQDVMTAFEIFDYGHALESKAFCPASTYGFRHRSFLSILRAAYRPKSSLPCVRSCA